MKTGFSRKNTKNGSDERSSLAAKPFLIVFAIMAISFVPVSQAAGGDVAVVMFNFQNNRDQPYTATYAGSIMQHVSDFYRENSYGNLNLDTDVFGWYTISHDDTSCSSGSWAYAAKSAAARDGFNENNYDYVIYAFPHTNSCGWIGSSVLGGTNSWNNGRFTLGIVGHELGHSMGLAHSSTYRCYENGKRVSIGGNCQEIEYTDPYDIMGSGTYSKTYAAHLNVFHKGSMGWFGPSNIQTVTRSGTYTIYASELSTSSVQSLRIPRDASNYYYLEYRKPYGYDDYWRFQGDSPASNGVSIRLAPDYSRFTETHLIDTEPGTLTFEDAPLQVGKTFSDASHNIRVTPVSRTPNSITVNVELGSSGTCRNNPTLDISKETSVSYRMTLTNNDGPECGSSKFSVVPTLTAGLSQSPRWVSINNVMPGSSISFKVSMFGSGTMMHTARNADAPEFYTRTSLKHP